MLTLNSCSLCIKNTVVFARDIIRGQNLLNIDPRYVYVVNINMLSIHVMKLKC